eukprot:CAMPEP_0115752796 /NCGR_PEP_ID=MMETSP0272-20121206/95984_1 /TAXON_ID=71861 /ORGANISM="Scrippsiella trochoidea, Strain CCMP3099" /LENGTH=385 /DNA_ID=CAMNT_0003198073 /DNA_START=41 /DNA_END=1196 /DNA_ORIENTATION=-
MSGGATAWIWDALAMGEEALIRTGDTSAFPWTATHPHFGSVIHAICFGHLAVLDGEPHTKYDDLITDSDSGVQTRFSLLELAVRRGAHPHVVAPSTCDLALPGTYFQDSDEENEGEEDKEEDDEDDIDRLEVSFAGKTAMVSLLEYKRVIFSFNDEAEWAVESARRIDRALEIVASAGRWGEASRVLVPEPMLDVIRTCAPHGQGSVAHAGDRQVRAHSSVLRAASPSRKEIALEDCSPDGVKVILALIYTSSLPGDDEEPSVETLMEALSLAHRWHVRHVVEMLEGMLASRLNIQSFEQIMELALRLDLSKLLQAGRTFIAANHQKFRTMLHPSQPQFRSVGVRVEQKSNVHWVTMPEGSKAARRSDGGYVEALGNEASAVESA